MAVLLDKLPRELAGSLPPMITEKTGLLEVVRQLKLADSDEENVVAARERQAAQHRESAIAGMLEVRRYLGLNARQRLIVCRPDVYRELSRDGTELEGAGAMVVRTMVRSPNGETRSHDIWVDGVRKPFSRTTDEYFGELALRRCERGGDWTFQHCVDPTQALNVSPRQQSFREQPAVEQLAASAYASQQPASVAA